MNTKFYVSTYDGAFGGGIRRLTPYFKILIEAENFYYSHLQNYKTLMLKSLTGKTRKVIKHK